MVAQLPHAQQLPQQLDDLVWSRLASLNSASVPCDTSVLHCPLMSRFLYERLPPDIVNYNRTVDIPVGLAGAVDRLILHMQQSRQQASLMPVQNAFIVHTCLIFPPEMAVTPEPMLAGVCMHRLECVVMFPSMSALPATHRPHILSSIEYMDRVS